MGEPTFSVAAANKILADNFAPWVQACGLTVTETSADAVTIIIPHSDHLCREGGTMSGQTLATGADTAMVLALAAAMGGTLKPCTTVDLSVSYMRPIAKSDAVIKARVIRLGRSLAFCTAEISDKATGKPAAHATGTFALL